MNKAQKIAAIVVATIILLGFLTSCEKIEEICDCTKTTYYYEDISTEYINSIETYIISTDKIDCADPITKENIKNNIYYNIECK